MRLLLLILFMAVAPASAQISWTQKTVPTGCTGPNGNGYHNIKADPISGQILMWTNDQSTCPGGVNSIYSSTMRWYNVTTDTWTVGPMMPTCHDSPTLPGFHHPGDMLAADTKRSLLWMVGGVASMAAGCSSETWHMYSLALNANPALNTSFTQMLPAHPKYSTSSTMMYIPENAAGTFGDFLFLWGDDPFHPAFMYCSTVGNPGGTLTAIQTASGCSAANDWVEITPANMSCAGADCIGGVNYPNVIVFMEGFWDAATSQLLLYGGSNQSGSAPNRKVWKGTFTSAAHIAWTESTSTLNPPAQTALNNSNWLGWAHNAVDGKAYFHSIDASSARSDWVYNIATDQWSQVQTGSGTTLSGVMAHDPTTNKLVSYANANQSNAVVFTGALPVYATLTVQELLYPGDKTGKTNTAGSGGVTRTNEPFSAGIPIADAAGITSASQLTLTGATNCQFRILASYPSGNAKWVKVTGTLASLAAAGSATVALTAGNGSCGPTANLATDGATISVATGVASFVVKKANFNGIDQASVGATPIVATSSAETRGFTLLGPSTTGTYPDNVTCGSGAGQSPCTKVYSSANDSSSTCTIEENGPAMAVVACYWTFKDSSANPYMSGTARLTFYAGKSYVRVDPVLRNANYDTSALPSPDCNLISSQCHGGTFNTAYKGAAGFEMRLDMGLTGTLDYTFGTHTTAQTGTLASGTPTDNVYLYQGASTWLQDADSCAYNSLCAAKFTTDIGYRVSKNSSDLTTGTQAQHPLGYANIQNSSGVGVEIGIEEMGFYYSDSLEFDNGGNGVRVGLQARQNTKAVYTPWPAWDIKPGVLLNFHAAGVASLSSEYLRFNHPLVARAAPSYYNSLDVFPFRMPTATQEDDYFHSVEGAASPAIAAGQLCADYANGQCIRDLGMQTVSQWPLGGEHSATRWPIYSGGGATKEEEFRMSYLQVFIRRGFGGHLRAAAMRYRTQAGKGWAHSDGTTPASSTINGFTWANRTGELTSTADPRLAVDAGGFHPQNYSENFVAFHSDNSTATNYQLWAGIVYYYLMTGDETYREAMMPLKAHILSTGSYYTCAPTASCGYNAPRGVGQFLHNTAIFGEFLTSVGDSDAANVLAAGVTAFNNYVKPDPCVNNWPAGCTMPPAAAAPTPPALDPWGVSRVRGVFLGGARGGGDQCLATGVFRGLQFFQYNWAAKGIWLLAKAKGPSWSDYKLAKDLSYGVARSLVSDIFHDDGTASWKPSAGLATNGQQYFLNGANAGIRFDYAQTCAPGTTVNNTTTFALPNGDIYNFTASVNTIGTGDGGWQGYFDTWSIIQAVEGGLSTDDRRRLEHAIDWTSTRSGGAENIIDIGQEQLAGVIYGIANDAGLRLRPVSFSVTDLTGGNYRLTFTPPAGTCSGEGCLRVKYHPTKSVVDWLNFDPWITNTFGRDPATNAAWFAATPTADPTPTPGVQQTFDVATGQTGLSLANFSVKAMAPQGCTISPASAGPFTAGQAVSLTFSASAGCSAGSYGATGLSGSGLSVNSSSGLLSGTAVSGSYSATFTYDTASQPVAILVNAAPSISTTTLPAGTQGTGYSQSLTTTGGTGTKTCSLTGGSLTGSGLTVNSNCTITGTASTPATYLFTATPTDANGIAGAGRSLSITINASGGGAIGSYSGTFTGTIK